MPPWIELELGHQEEGTRRKDETQNSLTSQPRVSELAVGGWPLALEAKGSEKEDLVLMSGRVEKPEAKPLNPLGG